MIDTAEGGKYRIPDISEFVAGFAFEVYSEGYFEDSIEDFFGWYRYVMGGNNWRDNYEIEAELRAGHIRALQPTTPII
jgi:hypothetical protein